MLQQLNLFEPVEIKPLPKPEKRCKGCKFLIRNNWNRNIKYCTKQRGKGTSTGWKKIKSNSAACQLFEPIENK